MQYFVSILLNFIFLASLYSQTVFPSNVFRMHASYINEAIHIYYTPVSGSPLLMKRIAGSADPFTQIAVLPGAGGEYVDSDVEEGLTYEYYTSNSASMTLQCGGKLPLVEQRGWYVILLDDAISAGITTEFKKFRQNLYVDGYRVKTILINRAQTPDEVRAILQQTNIELPGGINQVLLLGHIPVPYSGNVGHDVHYDHQGAWATDTYYADLDGEWLDAITVDHSARDANKNFPGDRKFDHDFMPSAAEITVGRVDMFDLPAFGLSETALINRYLTKNNLFKSGNLTIVGRGLETNGTSYNFSAEIARTAAPCVGINSLFSGPYTSLQTQPKLFSFGYGASNYDICGEVVSTADFIGANWFTVFTGFLGSYLWDFDNTNSIMRASLFSSGSILSCSYFPDYWQFMGLGKSIGDVNKMNQENSRPTSSNLHGDPSVRINYPIMPSNLSLTTNTDTSQVTLNWVASNETDEPLIGYNIYRSSSFDSIATRLNQEPVAGNSFTDENPLPGKNFYIVKLITVRPSGSGSFYNSSIGLIDSVIVPNRSGFLWNIHWNLNQSYCQGEEVSNILIEVLDGAIQNNQVELEISDINGSFETPSYAETIDIIDGEIQFSMPNILINNQLYTIRLSDISEDFTELTSSEFTFYKLPETSLEYSINYDTLQFHIMGDFNYISTIEISPNSTVSANDTLFIFAEEGEFTFTINSQNVCGIHQSIDTIYSTLNEGIITSFGANNLALNTVFYPNPVVDYLFVSNHQTHNWELINASGEISELVLEDFGNKIRFDFKKLKPGIYYLRTVDNSNKGCKIIKQ